MLYRLLLLILVSFIYLVSSGQVLDSIRAGISHLDEKEQINHLLDNAYSVFNKNFEDGLSLIDDMIQRSNEINYPTGTARATLLNGIFHYLKGDYKTALIEYQSSLNQYEELDDKSGMGAVLNEMSVFNRKQQDPEKAEENLDRSQQLCEDVNDINCLGTSHNNRGMLYQELGRVDDALVHYLKAIEYKRMEADSVGLSYSYNNMASIMIDEKRFDEAIDYINRSTVIREQAGDESGMAINLNNVGEVYYAKEEYLTAIHFFQKSLDRSLPIGFTDLARHTYNLLGEAFKKAGNYKQALITKEKSFALNDSLHNMERTKVIEEMEAKYETEKKEIEIEEQKARRQITTTSLDRVVAISTLYFCSLV